jgi:hypothetical protein
MKNKAVDLKLWIFELNYWAGTNYPNRSMYIRTGSVKLVQCLLIRFNAYTRMRISLQQRRLGDGHWQSSGVTLARWSRRRRSLPFGYVQCVSGVGLRPPVRMLIPAGSGSIRWCSGEVVCKFSWSCGREKGFRGEPDQGKSNRDK